VIPYADFGYWGLLLYPTVPTFLVAWGRRLRQVWILIATAGMLVVQYSAERVIGDNVAVREIWLVVGFAAFEFVLASGFVQIRRRTPGARWLFYIVLVLGLVPLVATRVVPRVAPAYQIGFLGISYLTFRSLDVLIGIQDRLIRSLPPMTYLAYVLFFPTISAGPIDRYRRFLDDWLRSRNRAEFLHDLDGAIHRIFTGFLYKFILAELIRRYWMEPAASQPGLPGTVSYMYAYSLYLFFDFAGYTAFAVGVGYLFGIHTPENFRRPFLARDIRDFWNRWHISLSWWFRDHVYMRFVMAATRGKWFGNRHVASYLGFFLSMGLMGLWHGPQAQYIGYGLYHGALLTGHDIFSHWNKQHRLWGDGPAWHAFGVLLTVQAVCFGFLIFSGHLNLSIR
jgi:membrane protein involved in D-alanine export